MLRLSHYAMAAMRVHIHTAEPKGSPAGIRFQDCQPELGKALQNSGEDKLPKGRHVVVRKSHGMIESAKRHRVMIWGLLAGGLFFNDQISKRLKALIPIFA